MNLARSTVLVPALLAASLLQAAPATAQQITGVPGSPGATRTISGKQLPPLDPKFGGVIKNDIGSDTLTGVNDADYKPPFPLTAKLNKLTIKVDRPKLSPDDEKKLMEAQRNNKMSE